MEICPNCGAFVEDDNQGIRFQNSTYCSVKCLKERIPDAEVILENQDPIEKQATQIHEGQCPICGRLGSVDIYSSYRVMSFLFVTTFQTIPELSCWRCAVKAKIKNGLITLFIGWWGTAGIILTPIYLLRNLFGCIIPATRKPSKKLKEFVKNQIEINKINNE
ncbi:MAG: hypothetical protein LBP59_04470 [Planctomycetaceae bacterium]|jgi:hypothetical protein|nr:hypothetical protein [Planctomycetaceae bacterium]